VNSIRANIYQDESGKWSWALIEFGGVGGSFDTRGEAINHCRTSISYIIEDIVKNGSDHHRDYSDDPLDRDGGTIVEFDITPRVVK
jgi:hypothetical protein